MSKFFTLLIGYIIIYLDNNKFSTIVLGGLFFMQKNVRLQNQRHTFIGDIYYNGRTSITFYDYELDKTILLEKKDLK